MTGDLNQLPIETAKAAQEGAKLGVAAIEAVSGAARAIASVFGSVPEDLVGRFGGDWLRVSRMEHAASLVHDAKARLAARGVTNLEPLSPSVGVPLLIAAADETRSEIRDLWERLLATAMNPSTNDAIRQSYIELVKRLDPLDARCFNEIASAFSAHWVSPQLFSGKFGVSDDAVAVSLINLSDLRLLRSQKSVQLHTGVYGDGYQLTIIGREFARALRG